MSTTLRLLDISAVWLAATAALGQGDTVARKNGVLNDRNGRTA